MSRKNYREKYKQSWMQKLQTRVVFYLLRGEVADMAMIYATLIIKGKRTLESVPAAIREQVVDILTDLEVPELTK